MRMCVIDLLMKKTKMKKPLYCVSNIFVVQVGIDLVLRFFFSFFVLFQLREIRAKLRKEEIIIGRNGIEVWFVWLYKVVFVIDFLQSHEGAYAWLCKWIINLQVYLVLVLSFIHFVSLYQTSTFCFSPSISIILLFTCI